MRGRPASGSMRRMICGGRYSRSNRMEPRREIGNAHFGAMDVGQDRLDDRGVAHIARLGLRQVGERDLAEPFLLVVGEQAARTPDRNRNRGSTTTRCGRCGRRGRRSTSCRSAPDRGSGSWFAGVPSCAVPRDGRIRRASRGPRAARRTGRSRPAAACRRNKRGRRARRRRRTRFRRSHRRRQRSASGRGTPAWTETPQSRGLCRNREPSVRSRNARP